ncbi:hypothetical protein [Mycoplasmopsis cynos]|uniref:hypothetical protein n=1 Tax=Mycoplasmopsis cynos TaxID=171284 RepID=UPI0029620D0F|nr:hypothetical protein [Mycoplasmopsis cynos]
MFRKNKLKEINDNRKQKNREKVEQAVKYEKTAIISKDKLFESGSYFGHKSHAFKS